MDQASVKYGALILRYNQPSGVTAQHYADDIIAKPCKVGDVYDDSTFNDVFIERVDSSV